MSTEGINDKYIARLLEQIKKLNQENADQAKLIEALEQKVKLLELRIKLLKQQKESVS